MSTNNLRDQLNQMGISGHYYNNVPTVQTTNGSAPNPFYNPSIPGGIAYVGPPQPQQITYTEWRASNTELNR